MHRFAEAQLDMIVFPTTARADTDCNHLAGPRVFHLLRAIVLADKPLGADHVLVAWVNHSAALIFTLNLRDSRRGTATVAIELRSHL